MNRADYEGNGDYDPAFWQQINATLLHSLRSKVGLLRLRAIEAKLIALPVKRLAFGALQECAEDGFYTKEGGDYCLLGALINAKGIADPVADYLYWQGPRGDLGDPWAIAEYACRVLGIPRVIAFWLQSLNDGAGVAEHYGKSFPPDTRYQLVLAAIRDVIADPAAYAPPFTVEFGR